VTLFGESSGGLTVELLAMAYSGKNQGLFRSGITSSITVFSPYWGTIQGQQAMYDNLTAATGCADDNDSLQCLRDRKSGSHCGLLPSMPNDAC
jgi:carboxylesterase type B